LSFLSGEGGGPGVWGSGSKKVREIKGLRTERASRLGSTGQASRLARKINDLANLLACLFYLGRSECGPSLKDRVTGTQKKGRPRSLPP